MVGETAASFTSYQQAFVRLYSKQEAILFLSGLGIVQGYFDNTPGSKALFGPGVYANYYYYTIRMPLTNDWTICRRAWVILILGFRKK